MFCRTASALTAALLLSAPAAAQIYKCDGKWTNLPCSGKVEAQLQEAPHPAAKEEAAAIPPQPADKTQLDQSDLEALLRNDAPPAPTPALQPSATPVLLTPRIEMIRKLRRQNDEERQKGRPALSAAEIGQVERFCMDQAATSEACAGRIGELTAKSKAPAKDWETELLGGDPNTLGQR